LDNDIKVGRFKFRPVELLLFLSLSLDDIVQLLPIIHYEGKYL